MVDLRGLDEAPVSPFAGAGGSVVDTYRSARGSASGGASCCAAAAASALMAADRLRERGSRIWHWWRWVSAVQGRVVMTLHTTEQERPRSYRGAGDRGEKALRPRRDVGRRSASAWRRSTSSSIAAGTCCASAARCANTAATPTKPRCTPPRWLRTTRVSCSSSGQRLQSRRSHVRRLTSRAREWRAPANQPGAAPWVHVEGVERLARRHEQAVALGPAEADVAADLGQADAADQLALRGPHRDAAVADGAAGVARDPEIAVDVGSGCRRART